MSKKIIAIGGGEIGRPGTSIETMQLDKVIVKEAKGHKLLFIPTAMEDNSLYQETIKNLYSNLLNCNVDNLLCCNNTISNQEIDDKIFDADIIYVGAGNTTKMLEIWKKKGIDKKLRDALNRGVVICGLSAGAICWFDEALSIIKDNNGKQVDILKGLGFIKGLVCPHYNVEPERRKLLYEFITNNQQKIAVAIDSCAEIYIHDNDFEVLSSQQGAWVHLVYYKDGKVRQKKLPQRGCYNNLFL